MYEPGDRVRTSSPVHGEMIGTILETDLRRGRPVYLVEWQTSKTGVIRSREFAGLDDLAWVRLGGQASTPAPSEPSPALDPRVADAIDRDPNLRSPHTRRAYKSELARFQAWRGDLPLTAALVEAYLDERRVQGKGDHAHNRSLAAIRWWARQHYRDALTAGVQGPSAEARAARLLQLLSIGSRPPPAADRPGLTPEGLEALLAACDHRPDPAGIRDAALISLASQAGLKTGEICALTRQDLKRRDDGFILWVAGGSGHGRAVPVTRQAAARMAAWMDVHRPSPSSSDDGGPLFTAIRKGGAIQDRGLSPEALRQILARRCRQAGVPRTSWQEIRRGLGEALLAKGRSVRGVGALLGLRSGRAVSRLDRRTVEDSVGARSSERTELR